MAMPKVDIGLVGAVIVFIVVMGYVYFYLNSGEYLNEGFAGHGLTRSTQGTTYGGTEGFQSANSVPVVQAPANESPKESLQYVAPEAVQLPEVDVPYTTRPINSLDDYEYNLIYQNESDRALSKGLRDKLMSQYPMDWPTQPPSSAQFQAGLREYFDNPPKNVSNTAAPYESITGNAMQPPDSGAAEAAERKLLKTYEPKFPPNPTAYDPADVEDLIKKIYDAKGEIPSFKKRDGAGLIYEITSKRKKNEKVVYEDEVPGTAPTGMAAIGAAGEGTIVQPPAVRDLVSSGRDSFFEEGSPTLAGGRQYDYRDVSGNKTMSDLVPGDTQTRTNRWDYTAFTQGLERMFAPTEPRQNWY